jgi:hypothetical protein
VCPWSFVTRPWPSATGPQCPQGRSVWPGWAGLVSRVPHGGPSLWFCDSISIGPSRRTRSCSLLMRCAGSKMRALLDACSGAAHRYEPLDAT